MNEKLNFAIRCFGSLKIFNKFSVYLFLHSEIMLKIYYTRISDTAGWNDDDFFRYISPRNRELIAACQNASVKREKMVGEGMLRLLLQRWGGRPAESWSVVRGEHGKPYLVDAPEPLFFNLCHSGDYVVCALSDREVGVDIQKIGGMKLEIARRFFHPSETEALETVKGTEQIDLFYRYWAVKESFLKYKGKGLSGSLAGFCMETVDGETVIRQEGKKIPVYLKECRIASGYCCFICAETADLPEILPFSF